jgi:hypothetical protein
VRPPVHRAGLRADVLTDGNIRVGDPIVPIENLEASPLRGVGVLLMREGRLLVGERLSGHATGTWSIPGGKPEADESDEACGRRDLLEEAGVVRSAPRVVAETVDTFADAGLTYRAGLCRWIGWTELRKRANRRSAPTGSGTRGSSSRSHCSQRWFRCVDLGCIPVMRPSSRHMISLATCVPGAGSRLLGRMSTPNIWSAL